MGKITGAAVVHLPRDLPRDPCKITAHALLTYYIERRKRKKCEKGCWGFT